MIGATGIWGEEEQGAHIFSYGVARYIGNYFESNKPVIDFGCGDGSYCEYLSDIGFSDIWGIDGAGTLSNSNWAISKMDLATTIELVNERGIHAGNVLCLEVFEHIPQEYESVFVDNITKHCSGKLIISVAHEGQQGLGHVNCRPDWYVKELFEGKGFTFNEAQTKEIRSCAEGYVAYLRENLFVFDKK